MTVTMPHPTNTREYPETPLTRGVKELWEAIPGYEKAEEYYEGDVPVLFAYDLIQQYLKSTVDRYRINFAKMVVDAVANRLEIASVVVPTSGPLTVLLNKIYKKNRMHRKGRTVHRRTAMYGDAYLFVWPENPDDPSIKFDVHYNNPKTTRAIYSREHPDRVEYVIKMWREPSPLGPMTWRANLYYPEHIEKWIAQIGDKNTSNTVHPEASAASPEGAPPLDSTKWDEMEEEHVNNPYGVIPIFHFRNDEPYGKPRHKDVYGAQDAINKLSALTVHTADFQGFPQRYGLADPNAAVGGAGDDTHPWDDDDEPGPTGNSAVESGPGTFIRLEGVRAAGSFPAADPKNFMDPARFFLRAMAQISTTPLRFFDPMGEPPSGEALRAMDAPLDKDAVDFQDMLEEPWADVYEFMLKVLGKKVAPEDRGSADPDDPDGDLQVDVQWKPVSTVDDTTGWDTIRKKIDAGVPAKQALMEAGYSQPQVDEWLKANESRVDLERDSEILVSIAAAARDLSQAVTANILDPGVAQHVLTNVLEKLFNEKLPEPPIKEEPIAPPIAPPPPPSTSQPSQDQKEAPDDTEPPAKGDRSTVEAARRLAPVSHR